MKVFTRHLLLVLLAAACGCADRRGPDVHADAGSDLRHMSSQPIGCAPTLPCQPIVVEVDVADLRGRFLSQSQALDLEACHAGVCGSVRVREQLDGGTSGALPVDGEVVWAAWNPERLSNLRLHLRDRSWPNPPGAVRLKIAIPGGSTLLEQERVPQEGEYSPNGPSCGPLCPIRRALFAESTGAEAPDAAP